jgi:hypothetical protein
MKPSAETDKDVGPIWRELYGGLWHTTHPERFLGILRSAAILPEPDIPDAERWGTVNGRVNYPFARFIGGVSLFDFHDFDYRAYEATHAASWREFVPYRRIWHGAVWIEIDRTRMPPGFVSADELWAKCDTDGNRAHNIMPRIEAAYVGALPVAAFGRALFISSADNQPRDVLVQSFDDAAYDKLLDIWRAECAKPEPDPLARILRARWQDREDLDGV